MLEDAPRTARIRGGWGSLPDNSFRGMNYAANFVQFYDDKNYPHYEPVSHPQLDGVFFFNKKEIPSVCPCMTAILKANYGNITAETIYSDIAGYQQTGDNTVVVMDPAGQQIWVSWSQFGEDINGYERSPIHVRLSDFWSEDSLGTFAQ